MRRGKRMKVLVDISDLWKSDMAVKKSIRMHNV